MPIVITPLVNVWRGIRWQYVAEIALMIVLGWFASAQYAVFDPTLNLGGTEAENLVVSAHYLEDSLAKLGYIPYWQPYSNEGQPFVDEAYNFVVNPFTFVPIALFGANNGIVVSIILHFMIAGVGGWYLAQSLGMGFIARILLGALLVVKGNMEGALGIGYFQLGIVQAYFPWLLAAAFAVARRTRERYPPVMLAVVFALLFFCGEIYYALPAFLIVLLVFALYAVRYDSAASRIEVDRVVRDRFVLSGLLSAGLMAVVALTVGLYFSLLGHHPSQDQLPPVDSFPLIYQFVNPEMMFKGLFAEFSYSYVIPLWFLVLIFVFLPPLRLLHLSANPKDDRRFWLIGGIGFLFFLAWGISLRPIVPWAYANIPLLGQWRFPERMLSVASFLLVFLIAFRVDGLNRALLTNVNYTGKRTWKFTRYLVGASVFVGAGAALSEVYTNYYHWGSLSEGDPYIERCIQWVVEQYPNDFINVQRRDFITMAAFTGAHIRTPSIGADYYVGGVAPTIYNTDLGYLPAPLYMPAWDETPASLLEHGFVPVTGSPSLSPQLPNVRCVWHNLNAPPYAFSALLSSLQNAPELLPVDLVTPVKYLGRTPEHIWLEANPSPTRVTVVVAQDVAYPGWTVLVDGKPAKLESVGRMLGVQLLPGTTPQVVEFIYTAPTLKLGGAITVITVVGSILYLLRAERVLGWRRRRHQAAQSVEEHPVIIPLEPLEPIPQPVMVAATPTPETYSNGHVTAEPEPDTRVIHVSAQSGAQIVLPPSDQPYHVEVVAPSRRNGIVTQVTLAGTVVVLTVLVIAQTRKQDGR